MELLCERWKKYELSYREAAAILNVSNHAFSRWTKQFEAAKGNIFTPIIIYIYFFDYPTFATQISSRDIIYEKNTLRYYVQSFQFSVGKEKRLEHEVTY